MPRDLRLLAIYALCINAAKGLGVFLIPVLSLAEGKPDQVAIWLGVVTVTTAIIISLPAGAITDGRSRRGILRLAALAQIVVCSLAGFLFLIGLPIILVLIILGAGLGVCAPWWTAAGHGCVRQLLGVHGVAGGQGLLMGIEQAALGGGAALGGLLLLTTGPGSVFVLLPLLSLVGLIAAWALSDPLCTQVTSNSVKQRLTGGLQALWVDRYVRRLLAGGWVWNVGAGLVGSTATVLMISTRSLDSAQVGAVLACGALGSGLAGFAARRFSHHLVRSQSIGTLLSIQALVFIIWVSVSSFQASALVYIAHMGVNSLLAGLWLSARAARLGEDVQGMAAVAGRVVHWSGALVAGLLAGLLTAIIGVTGAASVGALVLALLAIASFIMLRAPLQVPEVLPVIEPVTGEMEVP